MPLITITIISFPSPREIPKVYIIYAIGSPVVRGDYLPQIKPPHPRCMPNRAFVTVITQLCPSPLAYQTGFTLAVFRARRPKRLRNKRKLSIKRRTDFIAKERIFPPLFRAEFLGMDRRRSHRPRTASGEDHPHAGLCRGHVLLGAEPDTLLSKLSVDL